MKIIFKILLNTLAVYITAKVVPGISIDSAQTAVIVAIVLGLLNTLVKPFLIILTLPVNILTLGLFTFVINAFLITLTASFVPGFHVASFLSAVLFSLVLSIVGWFFKAF